MAAYGKKGASSKPVGGKKKKPAGGLLDMKFGSKAMVLKPVEVLLFTGELADLLEAGMTLGQALSCLANQGEEDSAQRAISQGLCQAIVNGEAFSDAIKRYPETFPPLYSNMVRAGESSGAMIEVLRRLVDHYERNDNMRGKIKSALSYPIVVLCFGVLAWPDEQGWSRSDLPQERGEHDRPVHVHPRQRRREHRRNRE